MATTSVLKGLATESTLRRLLASLHFARDSSDQLRVVAAGGGANTNAIILWNNGSYVSWYNTTGAPNSTDAREQMKAQARANVQQARTRWTFT